MAWAPDYVTDQDAKEFVRVPDPVDDAEVALAITSSSRAIDHHCNRQFGKVDAVEERLYTARYDYEEQVWIIDVDDFMSTTGLVVTVTDVGTLTDYHKEPVNAAQLGRPWERLRVKSTSSVQPTGDKYEVAMTALWGWTTVPTQVEQSAHLQTSRFLARRDSPFGVAGSPDQGTELRLLAALDPDVAVALRGLRRARKVG